jgi:hypothetical protein
MAIIKSAVRLIIREHPHYRFSGPVLTLGVPEIHATYPELLDWFGTLAGSPCQVSASQVELSDNEIGRKLGWVSAQTFFKAFGWSETVSLDIPGCEHQPDIIHDLNQPFPAELINRFSLVIDPGTVEHVFDVKTCLGNVVRALRIGGVVIHQVPVYSYNGGYYSINPNLLNDFYRTNGFESQKTFIIMWDRYRAYTGQNRCYEYSETILGDRHALADYDQCRHSPHMLFIARKTQDLPEIAIPVQFSGEYLSAVSGATAPESSHLGIRQLVRKSRSTLVQLLPYPLAFYLGSRLRRARQLYKSRRQSFRI